MSITALIPAIGKILDRVIPDKNARESARAALESEALSGELNLLLSQLEVNKAEALNPNVFVSGWRPFVGWCCGFALAYNTLVHPILDIWLEMPVVDVALLMPVLTGMLGLGGLRSFEKIKRVSRET